MTLKSSAWLLWGLSLAAMPASQAQQVTFDASTLGLADGAVVTSWGVPGAQAATGTPTYRTHQTPNGRAVVEFNGGGDRMGDNIALPASDVGDWILVAVIKAKSIGAYHNLVDDDAASRPMLWIDPSFNYELNFSGGGGAKQAGSGPNGWDIVIADSRLNQLYVNSPTPNASGRNGVAWSASSNERWDFFHRDGNQTFQGQVAEVRLYNNRADFNGDFAALYNELKAKWIDGVPPTANAGLGQSIHAGSTVNLDGRQSFDDNTPSAALGYAWSLVFTPVGSAAALLNAATATPSFVADKTGSYIAQLIVTDGSGLQSAPSQVTISSSNQAPTANAGADQLVVVFSTVVLNGSQSSDPDQDALSHLWAMTSAPAGSAAVLTGPNTATPNFQPDVPGSYSITLNVSDAFGQGTPDTVEITAATGAAVAEQQIIGVAGVVGGLGASQVTTPGNRTALGEFLSQAIKSIQKGNTATAISKLNAAIERTDGCEANPTNQTPDGNGPGRDWVTDCTAQRAILASLRAARDALTSP